MKASKQSIGRSVDQPNPQIRFYLLYGPDEAQARAMGERLVQALGASKVAISSSQVKSDPASLVDEASAMSLFGGKRVVWVEPASKEIEEGIAALLEAPALESPVVAIGGSLPKSSALVKLAEGSPNALSFAAYVPEGQDAERMVTEVGRRFGLKVSPALAARLADNCDNDQSIVSQELQKLALYMDASPHSPKELDSDAIEAVGATSGEGDFARLADLALSGNLAGLIDELDRMTPGGNESIPVVRSLQRRLLVLAPARAKMDRGESLDAVMTSLGKALFWKDKPVFGRMLSSWDSERLARVIERAGALERDLMFSPAPEQEALSEELIAIALQARRRPA